MSILDHFRPVPAMTADELRSFLEDHEPGSYNIVDVRQPGEYQGAHFPGARLIPLSELEERLGELDPAKPTVTY